MKYILPLLLLLSACTPDTKTTDAASAPKTHGFAHRLTEGEKLLTQALIKQDLAAYFKHETGGAFAEQAPLFSAQQLAEQKNIPKNDAIGVYGKIIKPKAAPPGCKPTSKPSNSIWPNRCKKLKAKLPLSANTKTPHSKTAKQKKTLPDALPNKFSRRSSPDAYPPKQTHQPKKSWPAASSRF